ncbi:MAG: heat-shock protein Hsp33 [Deltaproteobacteria bacterium HGW-Deltaproteobacteria-14]|jgi:molecular chaperone Hsp33|nr:MAG: heat-shock protein Hsp33 [Deltaproteobacteria bacterium HGW-Deltaproteobacteria-14]
MQSPSDRVLRAVTEDGSFRVISARTTEMVREGARIHGVTGPEARLFGELLTAAVLIRETMSPGHRVQVAIGGAEGGSMVADSHPDDGLTRGLVSRGAQVERVRLGPSSLVKVVRTLARGLHQSVVEAGSDGVSGAMMSYLQASEQVTATLGVATVMDGDRVVASGGYVVQLLPECQQGPLMVMTERLADFASLDDFVVRHDADAGSLLGELLFGFHHERLSDEPLVYGCICSAERALGAISTLGAEELHEAASAGEALELTCEYCNHLWSIPPEQIRTLLTVH